MAKKSWKQVQDEMVKNGLAVVVFCGCPGRENFSPPTGWEGTCARCRKSYSIVKPVMVA